MVFREFLFFFALVLTTYDALQNAPPKISDAPPPVPFFRKGSLVNDWYKGQLSEAFPIIFSYEISFVMYYAPWDAESQHTKHEFDKAAQIMYKQIHFAAINCWNPGGECRSHHVHINVWPILIVHTNLWKTLVYNGPKDYISMVKFLSEVIKPFEYLTSNNSLLQLTASCDAVVLGFIPMESDPLAYNVFYNVALKRLEYDPFRDICFGIITSEKLAVEMGVENIPLVKLLLWNNTMEYPINMPFNEENISNWLFTHVYIQAAWIMPSWHKSVKLQGLFNQHPVLILFTPRNLFQDRTPSYDLLKEVSLEYNNCLNNSHIQLISSLIKVQRRKYAEFNHRKKEICKEFNYLFDKGKSKSSANYAPKSHIYKNVWLNQTSCQKEIFNENLKFFSLNEGSYFDTGINENVIDIRTDCVANVDLHCSADFQQTIKSPHDYDIIEMAVKAYITHGDSEKVENSKSSIHNDPRSSINLLKRHLKQLCSRVELAQNAENQAIPIMNDKIINIEGLRCQTNNSLYFIAIDSILSPQFAESLGVDITKKQDKTAIVILDNKHETQYLFDKPIGEQSIREFVHNFTMNLLPRNLRTPIENSNHYHYYGSDREFKNAASSNNNASSSAKDVDMWCENIKREKIICIKELNTTSFQAFVSQNNKALLVVFCSRGAGACGGVITLVVLSLVRTLSQLGSQFEVARIDTSVNDLPWEYTFSKYPTLVFFPSMRKEDSRSYPEHHAITVEGVLAFVLTGLDTPVRLHAQVLLCNNTMDNVGMKKCLSNVRQSVVNLIGNTLRHWRRNRDPAIKNILLRRLQSLRTVAINLGALNTTKVPLSHPTYKMFDYSIQRLSNIWKKTINPLSKRQRHLIDYENL